jgi:hypothetical protein
MIFGAEFARRVVVVDFPEDAPTFVLKRAEVVLTVRVVLGREGLELHDLGRDGDLVAQGQGGNALRSFVTLSNDRRGCSSVTMALMLLQ